MPLAPSDGGSREPAGAAVSGLVWPKTGPAGQLHLAAKPQIKIPGVRDGQLAAVLAGSVEGHVSSGAGDLRGGWWLPAAAAVAHAGPIPSSPKLCPGPCGWQSNGPQTCPHSGTWSLCRPRDGTRTTEPDRPGLSCIAIVSSTPSSSLPVSLRHPDRERLAEQKCGLQNPLAGVVKTGVEGGFRATT